MPRALKRVLKLSPMSVSLYSPWAGPADHHPRHLVVDLLVINGDVSGEVSC